MDSSTNTNQHAFQGLFTEKLRPKSINQMILLPRVREELSKGLVDNLLLHGRPGTGKCLGYDEVLTIYTNKYNASIFQSAPWDVSVKELSEDEYKIELSIGILFQILTYCEYIKPDVYEEIMPLFVDLQVKDLNGNNKPILGLIRKHVELHRYTLSDGSTITCSNMHLFVDESLSSVRAEDAYNYGTPIKTLNGTLTVICDTLIGEGTAFDISISAPHLYYTSNGIIHHNTTSTRILAGLASDTLYINASQDRGIDIIRDKIMSFGASSSLFDGQQQLKVVMLEECDNLTPEAWAALRATIELFSSSVRFIANCNYIERVPDPIQSRFNVIPFEPQNHEEEQFLYNEYVKYIKMVLPACKITYDEGVVERLVSADFPDMRSLVKKCQQFMTRGLSHLSLADLGLTFNNAELFNMIIQPNANPVENYKSLVANWSTKAEEAIIQIGKEFTNYLLTVAPEKSNKIPVIVIAIAEYQAQLPTAIDKFIVLLALVYKLQMILST